MKIPEGAVPETDMRVLRSKISVRYSQYQQRTPGRFPTLDYNTNRANYEPLRDAFEEEFYVARGLERNSPTLHIPSTNTLMLLFTETAYVPGRKILNTCWSFADGPAPVLLPPQLPVSPPVRFTPTLRAVALVAVVLSISASIWTTWYLIYPAPTGLVLSRPMAKAVVPQEVVVAGRVTDAQTVWIVVRSVASQRCWVQPPICVQSNGNWTGVMYIGRPMDIDNGYPFDVRAFVEPEVQLKSGEVLSDWPKAKLSTPISRIVRGAVDKQN